MTGSNPPDFADRCTAFLRDCGRTGSTGALFETRGKLTRVAGLVMESTGLKLPLGSVCAVEQRDGGIV
ncbi:MAG: flagellum-specific ATP synthase FliI, partial [Burkholderiales bacterium]|nr:flagellum-specific ATP synthase FliI [Burkholderiales bacterium]